MFISKSKSKRKHVKRHKYINGQSATTQLARREQLLAKASAPQEKFARRGRLLAYGEQKWVATAFRPFFTQKSQL